MRRPLLVVALLLLPVSASSATAIPRQTGSDVRFATPLVGWVGGAGGVYGTRDGGRTWARQVASSRVFALDAVDARHAWALNSDSLLATGNGGRAWARHGLPTTITAIDFVTSRAGWGLSGRGEIFASSDGGLTWRKLRAPAGIAAICRTSPTAGLAAGRDTVFATTDSGTSWHRVFRVRAHSGVPFSPALRCTSGASWLMLTGGVAAGSQGYAVYTSRDTKHWRLVLGQFITSRVPRIDAYPGPFSVVDRARAFFIGFCPACGRGSSRVLRTSDRGRHWWRSKRNLDGFSPDAVWFADSRTGFLLAADQRRPGKVVWKTTDSGSSWARVFRLGR